jgi:hypothetical protein
LHLGGLQQVHGEVALRPLADKRSLAVACAKHIISN